MEHGRHAGPAAVDSDQHAEDEIPDHQVIAALEATLETITRIVGRSDSLRRPPPLGGGATAMWLSDRMLETATDQRGMLTQLEAAQRELPKLIETLRTHLEARETAEQQDDETNQT
ncbi:hypothetical protein AB5J62_24780 [Amycolatopsis sp. cg5]|uniref:hypothetical protein n=1 Tax=Amycolatopsis sp. cg5 TaxID=3238802 RepID=UPI0035263C2C